MIIKVNELPNDTIKLDFKNMDVQTFNKILQGKKLYFVCLAGRIRSKRAAELFASRFETAYFGMNRYAYYEQVEHKIPEYVKIALQKKLTSAEYIFVMEKWMKDNLEIMIGYPSDKIVALGIEDKYKYESPELEALLLEKITPYVKGLT